ncbi:MAG: hypothetical protein M5U09_11530 [Gammaproteobacteria bacterium]|nr:hypothetical protein [Gammaproteobacteria bacterium]
MTTEVWTIFARCPGSMHTPSMRCHRRSRCWLRSREVRRPPRDRQTFEEAADSGVRLFAQMPTLIASYHAIRTGREPPPPDPAMGYAENFLFMLSLPCSRENIAAISRDAIIHADNGASSATFAALTATGAWASLHDSVAAAIHTFKGGRHGYAAETAYGQLVRLRGPNEVSVYVDGIYDKGRTPPGIRPCDVWIRRRSQVRTLPPGSSRKWRCEPATAPV